MQVVASMFKACDSMFLAGCGLVLMYDVRPTINRWRNPKIVEMLPRPQLYFHPAWQPAAAGPGFGRLCRVHIFRTHGWVRSPRVVRMRHGKLAQPAIKLRSFV